MKRPNRRIPIPAKLTAHEAGALIAAANIVLTRGEVRGIGWDGTQLRTLRTARARFEQAAIDAFDLGDRQATG